MSPSRQENAVYLLSWVGRVLVAASGMSVGASLAVVSLLAKPVEVVKKPLTPAQLAEGKLVFQPGDREFTRGRQWANKRKALFGSEPNVVEFSEEELNAWLSTTFRTPPPPNPKAPPPPVVGEGLNFRIVDGVLQVGLPLQLNYFAEPMKVIVQARGHFAAAEGRWYFEPQEFWVGQLPAHRLPGFLELVRAKQLDASWMPSDVLATWKRIAEMRLEDRLLQVRTE